MEATGNKVPLLKLSNIRKSYKKSDSGEHLVLDGVDISIEEGEIVALLGRSGSGKSTLLRIISGLAQPGSGEALYCGKPITGPTQGLAMVFQSFALFPWLTVLENVELGLDAMGVPQAERRRRALEAIDLIGLDGFESAYPKELSGGMRQRVGFARALVVEPTLLLMDEPFSALDVLTAETLRTDLIELWLERRIPTKGILLVSHNIEEAVLLADRIIILGSNPGRVVSEIKVPLAHPRDRDAPLFRQLVDTVYGQMTQRSRAAGKVEAVPISYLLPEAHVNQLSGLLEALAAEPYNGKADLPELAEQMGFGVDQLFPLLEALDILNLARIEGGDADLTASGKSYVDADILRRKEIFAEHLVRHVALAAHIRRVLDDRPGNRAKEDRFLRELEDFFSEETAETVLQVAIEWGRYAELFAYDEGSGILSLENPASGEHG
ncbi:ABC transporter, ATP-binding protein with C-terminal AAA-associated domain [Citrifermentans bremense]|uniref:Nitrate ABC transporter ATP-binding protein n=2 Tax=Geobacteraceae TaxID=213422 RepID=A0ABQ0MLB8_9BACT|nr:MULTISPECIES: nitrate/sulfonate/bicarbonate ABC transporter ATP-binding protein [Geobacteraceae]BCG45681.1 ABC transporter, ATP-binding protein with C-terminal AAA-associated domain [Citrifermentans bremense]GAW67863.1 nitrate ABC transporter ATP-binding protein [Geoanaerobacter pelophilus]